MTAALRGVGRQRHNQVRFPIIDTHPDSRHSASIAWSHAPARSEPSWSWSLRSVLPRVVRVRHAPERFHLGAVVTPAKRRDLTGTHSRGHTEAVVEPAIEWDLFVGDEDLGFLAREHRAESPLGILVDEWPELGGAKHCTGLTACSSAA
jgi:hypothetical protein